MACQSSSGTSRVTWQQRRIMAIWLSHRNSEQWGLGYGFKLFADFLELVQSSLFEFLDIIDFFLNEIRCTSKAGGSTACYSTCGFKAYVLVKRFVLQTWNDHHGDPSLTGSSDVSDVNLLLCWRPCANIFSNQRCPKT